MLKIESVEKGMVVQNYEDAEQFIDTGIPTIPAVCALINNFRI